MTTSRCCVFTASILSWLFVGAHGHLRARQERATISKHEEQHVVFGNDSKVHVLTISTGIDGERHNSSSYKRLRGPGWWNYYAWNAAAGRNWRGFISKPELLLQGLAVIPDDDVAVYLDGGDTMYAGCQEHDFLDRFAKICNVTGAKVVVGAEYCCSENGDCTTFPFPYRKDVLRAFNTTRKVIDGWGYEKVRPRGDFMSPGACNFPGCSLKYLNSGFIAAKARDLRWFARQWLEHYEENITYGNHTVSDQARASAVMRHHPNDIVLDYAGALVNNLYGNIRTKSSGKKNQSMFEFNANRMSWVNSVLGVDACFFHGNGKSDLPWFTISELNQALHKDKTNKI